MDIKNGKQFDHKLFDPPTPENAPKKLRKITYKSPEASRKRSWNFPDNFWWFYVLGVKKFMVTVSSYPEN